MPRLLYVTLSSLKEGGASYTHVHEIIKGLEKRGWEVELRGPTYEADGSPSAKARIRAFLAIQNEIKSRLGEFDAIYCRSHFALWPTAWRAARRKLPIFHEVNGPYMDVIVTWPALRRIQGFIFWLYRWQFRRARALVTVTDGLRALYQAEYPTIPVHLIPNGADTDLFHPGAKSELALPPKYAVFFGHLAKWQGIGDIMVAFQSPTWPKDVALVIAGDGADRPLIEEVAAKNPALHYLGKIPYLQVPGLVAGSICSLVVQSGAGERNKTGLAALKLFESMACGVPVVVSDWPGHREVVAESRGGILVPPSDPPAIAAAVSTIANDEGATEMGARGRDYAVSSASWDKRAEDTHQVLDEEIRKAQR